ncbi:hypothetical protein SynA1562_02670 [Synechococcus sp. A15-62]|nr:hypothetical protein SynA1562_02670 [Synechococcus sp. A15-62]
MVPRSSTRTSSDRQAQLAKLTIKSVAPNSQDMVGRMKKLFQTLLS